MLSLPPNAASAEAPPHEVRYLDLADYLWPAGAALDRAPAERRPFLEGTRSGPGWLWPGLSVWLGSI